MRVEIESSRISDQTSPGWTRQACKVGDGEQGHLMISIKVLSELVPYVEQCEYCGWIDPTALQFHGENAIKNAQTNRAKRIAVAVESEPFQFAQSSTEELTLDEILGQALGAASVCWESIEAAGVFDSTRAGVVFRALKAEVDRALLLAKEQVHLENAAQAEGQVPV